MGMFDEMRVDYPLPDLPEWAAGETWQTKYMDCQMDHFLLNADGELHRLHWDRERQDYDIDPAVEDFTGGVNFYTGHSKYGYGGYWIEYVALIKHGTVLHVERTRLEEPSPAPSPTQEPT